MDATTTTTERAMELLDASRRHAVRVAMYAAATVAHAAAAVAERNVLNVILDTGTRPDAERAAARCVTAHAATRSTWRKADRLAKCVQLKSRELGKMTESVTAIQPFAEAASQLWADAAADAADARDAMFRAKNVADYAGAVGFTLRA